MISRRRKRADDHEPQPRFEGKDYFVSYGGLDFKVVKGPPPTLDVTCTVCSAKQLGLSGEKLKAFYAEHHRLHMPQPAPELDAAAGDIEQLVARVRALPADEREVLALVVEGLERGLQVYGELHLDRDTRDFEQEALEELRDAAIYGAAGVARRRRQARAGARR
jgi:hypothetical protein